MGLGIRGARRFSDRGLAVVQNGNGARHRCQAPLRRGWICRCSLSCRTRRPPAYPILTHQLRRRFQSGWIRGSSPARSSPHPEGWLASRTSFASAQRLWRPDIPRPFLGWFPSRGLSPWGGNRPREARNQLFRRLLPTGPVLRSAASSPRGAVRLRISRPSPAGGDRTFCPFLSFWSLPTFRRGRGIRPDHPLNMRTIPSRAKRNL